MRNLSTTALAAVLAAGLLLPGTGHAQTNPTVQQTIDALKLKSGTSRGSRPVVAPPATTAAPAPAARTAVAAPAPAPVQPATDAPAIDFNILFATGSADLTPAALKTLDTIGKALTSPELSSSRFRIEGHTDTTGTVEGNKELSARRAEAVVQYLSAHYGIQPNRLEALGLGEEHLLIQTGPGVNEPRNRRVRIVNITG